MSCFLDVGTRRVHLAGCTNTPSSTWVTQQARQLVWSLAEEHSPKRLIHDRDTKFTRSFDAVFTSEGIDVLLTPFQAPNANAFAERWVRSVRQECLDHVLILNEEHVRRVLKEYVAHFNMERPHQGLAQQMPVSRPASSLSGPVQRRDILGGIIHEYYRAAA